MIYPINWLDKEKIMGRKKLYDEKLALVHEFAHVLYIVPNLRYYSDFIKNQNWHEIHKNHSDNHSIYDPSYTFLKSIDESFAIKYKEYLRNVKNNGAFKQK